MKAGVLAKINLLYRNQLCICNGFDDNTQSSMTTKLSLQQ